MTGNPFLNALGFEEYDPDFDHVERRFLAAVKGRIQAIQKSYDPAEVKASEKWLRDFHAEFFQYSLQWANQQLQKDKDVPNHPAAPRLKKEARGTLTQLQTSIIEFAVCYMHLDRYLTILRDEIREEESRIALYAPVNAKWTPDVGEVIMRYKKNRRLLRQRLRQFDMAQQPLEQLSGNLDLLRDKVTGLFGNERSTALMRSFIASLRVADFTKSKRVLGEIEQTRKKFVVDQKKAEADLKDILSLGNEIISFVQEKRDLLSSRDVKLFLRPEETMVIRKTTQDEVDMMNGFLAKYHLPYIQGKLEVILHLREKLLIVGSLESLLTLYKHLINGIARPMSDERTIREYEIKTLERVRFLLAGQFAELPNIIERAEKVVHEFRESREDFKEIESDLEKARQREEASVSPEASQA